MKAFLKEGDILVLDRGYRDVVDYIKSLGFDVAMPHYLKKGAKQHTTLESNESRMVTKARWIVESRNGHLKTVFKFFDKQVSARDSEHVAEYFKIACALLNAFYPVIFHRMIQLRLHSA